MSCDQMAAAVNFAFGGGRQSGDVANVVADENGFERHGRLRALMRGDVGVQRGDDFRGGGLLIA